MLSPIAYLTCELKGRDLDSRFLIAAHLAKLGYYSVVGSYWGAVASATVAPRGCYLFKTTNSVQARAMEGCAKLGHKVVAADEEAIAQSEAFAHTTTDRAAAAHCHLFLAISEAHKRGAMKAFPEVRGKIATVGSARFDILRSANTQRPRPAPYILLNLIFGLVNSTWGNLETATDVYCRSLNLNMSTPDARQMVDDRLEYERVALAETKALVRGLIDRTSLDIVIRPHPSERPEYWRDLFAGEDRVEVVGRSDPVQWIQHAALMIHCDSTTGIEAALLGTPCINLSAHPAWAARLVISESNHTVRTSGEAEEVAAQFLAAGRLLGVPQKADDLFPRNGAMKTARKMTGFMGKPKRLSALDWNRIERTDLQREKFTVTPEEASDSLRRMSAIAGVQPGNLRPLDESVFLLTPTAFGK